ncbi:MAG: hypothetical protein ACJ749_00910 [Flavisolibacter sp.]
MKQPAHIFYPAVPSYEGNLKQGLKLAIPVSVVIWVIILSAFL